MERRPLVYTACATMDQPILPLLSKAPSLGCLSLHTHKKELPPSDLTDTCQDVLKLQTKLKGNVNSTYEPKFWSPSAWFESWLCHATFPVFTHYENFFIWKVGTNKRSHVVIVNIKWDNLHKALPGYSKGSISIHCYYNNYNTKWHLVVNILISCVRLWTEVLDGRDLVSFISTFLVLWMASIVSV